MTTEAEVPLSQLLSVGEAWLEQRLDAAREYRKVGPLPEIEHGPVAAVNLLLAVRLKIDAVEELLTEIARERTRVRRLFKATDEAVVDGWNAAVTSAHGGSRTRSFDGWGDAAPRERYAVADLKVLDKRHEARTREKLLDAFNDAVTVVRDTLRGLEGVRNDLHLIVRAMTVERSLER